MAMSDDEEVSFLDIKLNLNNYSLKRVKGLASALIDFFVDLTNEKGLWNETLEVSKNEIMSFVVKVLGLGE